MRKLFTRTLALLAAMVGLCQASTAVDFSAPQSGKVYRIWNTNYTSHFMYENTSSHVLATKDASTAGSYDDLFLVEASGSGYTLRNVQSGQYVGQVNANETQYPTGADAAVFTISKNNSRSDVTGDCYNLTHSWDNSWCMHEAAGQRVVRWRPTSAGQNNHPSEWQFEEVEFTDAMKQHLNNAAVLGTGVYYIVNDQRHKPANWYAAYNSSKKGLVISRTGTPKASNFHGYFLLRAQSDGTFTIQDLETGLYAQKVNNSNQIVPLDNAPYSFYIQQQAQATTDAYWNIYFDDPSKNDWCWHADGSNNIVRWHPWIDNNQAGLSPSEWKFIKDTTLTAAQVKARLAEITGAATPQAGKAYRIFSREFDRALVHNYTSSSNPLQTQASDGTYVEVWQLEASSRGTNAVNLKNVVTGEYVAKNGSRGSTYSMTTTAPSTGFTIVENTSDPYATVFEILNTATANLGLNDNEGTHNIYVWDKGNKANIWYFQEVKVDSAELASQQASYQQQADLLVNKDKYATAMSGYFSDHACTTLKSDFQNMSDADLTANMTTNGLPQVLQGVVLRMKNQTWKTYASGTNWEKRFRIQDMKPYCDVEQKWSREMGLGYAWGNLTGPTGITVQPGNTLFIFIDKVPANARFVAELIQMGSRSGDETALKEGMNVILVRAHEYNLNIKYWVNTLDNLNNGQPYTLADFPNVTVHIEGGEVNGCFDRTAGDDNATWKTMKSDGLAWAQSFNAKTEYLGFNMPSSAFKNADNDDHMADLLDMWNCILKDEEDLMGFRKDYAGRFNGILCATGVDHNYMYASTGGSYFNYNTLGEVLNYKNFSRRDGMWWGPAHEFGHNHQQLFNMAGMTEISNNVFSNQVLFKNGKVTSRSEYGDVTDPDGVTYKNMPWSQVKSLATYYANKTDWIDYNLWACTQMMYKLYMYYHAAGNDTLFYQKVFHLMKDSPMTKQKTPNCTGLTDYLKFATTCCEAAQEDLSDLFKIWGFYHPIENKEIGDYGTTIMNTTQAMIDEALAKMHSYPKKGGHNMMFIEDHIRTTPAIYPGHAPGEMRQNYNDICAFGRMGDVGNWDQFCPDSQGVAQVRLISAERNSAGRYTFNVESLNSHLVGFKVYNQAGELIWFANELPFNVPAKVIEDNGGGYPIVKACGSDGSESFLIGDADGIAVIDNGGQDMDAKVNVYTTSGIAVRHNVNAGQATAGLPAGLYIVGGKKVVVK